MHDGNYLRNSWYYVLDCISKIDNLYAIGEAKQDSEFFVQKKQSQS
jgi:hypothetical protein